MRTPIKEELFAEIKKELSPGIKGATFTWWRRFNQNNIKITPEEVEAMIDLYLLTRIRKWRQGKWEGTETKCKFESYLWTYVGCMFLSYLDKHCGLYSKKKDGTKYLKRRERIPEQCVSSLSDACLFTIEGGQDEETEIVQIIRSETDRDPSEILVAKDVLEKLLVHKPKYRPLIEKLLETESVEDVAIHFDRKIQTVYTKMKRLQKCILELWDQER